MAFIDLSDLQDYMEADEIDQITDGDNTIIEEIISDAEEFVAEKLRNRYQIENEFQKTGTDRNGQLKKQTVAIALMYVSERIPTNFSSEARVEAYERAEKWLKEVSSGMRQVTLEEIDSENQTGFSIRWGSGSKTENYRY